MNISGLLGIIGGLAIFAWAIHHEISNTKILFDIVAVLMVMGGTTAAALMILPLRDITKLFQVFIKRMLGYQTYNFFEIMDEISALATVAYKGGNFEAAVGTLKVPFLKEGAEILFWIESEITSDELRTLLETRVHTHFDEYLGDAEIFLAIAKFPPAFGLMGTTIGMIALLQSLGNNSNGIGSAMAVALVATLYGLVLSNLIFIPIAENLAKQTREDNTARRMIVEGLMLIQAKKHPRYVEEKVKSFLLPSKRNDPKKKKAA